jgi:NOL1/NOP2/fmu family ribosome biogenesis protein
MVKFLPHGFPCNFAPKTNRQGLKMGYIDASRCQLQYALTIRVYVWILSGPTLKKKVA